LFYETQEDKYLLQAHNLIQDVHNVLGKERDRDKRLGNSTEENPLLGGLRIGKTDAEGTQTQVHQSTPRILMALVTEMANIFIISPNGWSHSIAIP